MSQTKISTDLSNKLTHNYQKRLDNLLKENFKQTSNKID